MKITVKEAKIYTADDFKAAAEEERFKNRAEIWADQFNAHAEYIGLKDRAHVEKDIHGCDSVVWDYGYIVAKDPFGDKWQVRFGDNAYTMANTKVTPYVYRQMDSMTGFKGESRKSERVDFGARTISIPIGTFHSYDLAQDVANRITSACDYIEADARQQGHRTDEWVTVLTFEPKYFRDFKSYYTENYDSYCYMVTSTMDDFIRPDELEVRAYKSESRKNEASDSIRVYDEDLMVELTSVERYDDRFTDVPVVGDKFDLLEFRDLVEGLAETSNGYPDISRDGSELRVAIEVAQGDGDEYREELVLRGTVRVMHAALEQVVEYLEG